MPKYSKTITCPTTASHKDRTTEELIVSSGIISQVSVTWSFGSNLLNALVVKDKGGQIIPSEGGGECRGNGTPETWAEHIKITGGNPKLVIEVWNEGNSYEQDAYISIMILPEMPKWAKMIQDFLDILRRVLGL